MNIWLVGVKRCVCPPVVSSGCPWMWDNLTCWQPAKIGEVVMVNCPELFSQFMSEEDYGQFLNVSHSQVPSAVTPVEVSGLLSVLLGFMTSKIHV